LNKYIMTKNLCAIQLKKWPFFAIIYAECDLIASVQIIT